MRALDETTIPEQFTRRLAELATEVHKLGARLRSIEDDRGRDSSAQQTDLVIHSYEDDDKSIQLLTENGFSIVRPWELNEALAPAGGLFRFRVQDPEGIEREISVAISTRLLTETNLRTRRRIEPANQFWTSCAERRLANYLMEHDEFPPADEMKIETLDREDLLLAIRWEQTT